MANISDAASSDLAWVIDYIIRSNGLEKPTFDDKSIEVLARHYAELGYSSQLTFLEDLKNRPFWTLLTSLLYLDVAFPSLTAEEHAQLQDAADSLRIVSNNLETPNVGERVYQDFLNFSHLSGASVPDTHLLEALRDQPKLFLLTLIVVINGSEAAIATLAKLNLVQG